MRVNRTVIIPGTKPGDKVNQMFEEMKNKNTLADLNKSQLLELVNELQQTIKKKNTQLYSLRTNLSVVKGRLRKMKDTVSYQRKRILELYP